MQSCGRTFRMSKKDVYKQLVIETRKSPRNEKRITDLCHLFNSLGDENCKICRDSIEDDQDVCEDCRDEWDSFVIEHPFDEV